MITARPGTRSHRRFRARVALAATVLSLAGLAGVVAPAAATPKSACCGEIDGLVVKITTGHDLDQITRAFPVDYDRALLRSRGIYKLQPRDEELRGQPAKMTALAERIEDYEVEGERVVAYAEPNYATVLNANRFHSWPEGPPKNPTRDSGEWQDQPITSILQLRDAHAVSLGLGVRVAVLDTGIDFAHPAMIGRTRAGYDYVDDDADPTDERDRSDANGNGQVDDAYGHGTFVAGLLGLVAPDARIIPMRVLNSDGVGNVFVVSQAILDAADQGAKVINVSFSTDQAVESRTLSEAIAAVQARGVIVVAAAGNNASTTPNYPAADPGVLSVTATNDFELAYWANRGSWVKVAAPGSDLIGPVPGGTYASWSGTSMATPLVAGQVALIRAKNAGWTPDAVQNAVTSTTDPLGGVEDGSVDVVKSLTG